MEVLHQKGDHVEGQLYDPNSLSPYSTSTSSSSSSSTSPGSSVIPGMMYPEYAEWHLNGMEAQRQSELQQYQYMTYPQQTDLLTTGNYWQSDLQVHPGLPNNPYQSTDRLAYSTDYSAGVPTQMATQSSESQSPPTTKSGKPKRKRVQSISQRKAANIRERRRMFHLNEAFDTLRKRLPAFNYEKRLSRIETLRLAMTYIAFMKDISDGEDPKDVKLQSFHDAMGNMFSEHMSGSDGSLGEELGDL